jgi:hypothetical protein
MRGYASATETVATRARRGSTALWRRMRRSCRKISGGAVIRLDADHEGHYSPLLRQTDPAGAYSDDVNKVGAERRWY